ncbi:MAG: hypothetical protein JJ714_10695 [Acidithiobacillus sp.]|nr:hypothetical protein [Acidithiobacillus sp.]
MVAVWYNYSLVNLHEEELMVWITNQVTESSRDTERKRMFIDLLADSYRREVGHEPVQDRTNELIIDAFIDHVQQEDIPEIESFLATKNYIFERIKSRIESRRFFKQPTVLLVYFLAAKMPAQTRALWPIVDEDLALIFGDLGKKF